MHKHRGPLSVCSISELHWFSYLIFKDCKCSVLTGMYFSAIQIFLNTSNSCLQYTHIQEHVLCVTQLNVIAISFGKLALQTSLRGSNMTPSVCHHFWNFHSKESMLKTLLCILTSQIKKLVFWICCFPRTWYGLFLLLQVHFHVGQTFVSCYLANEPSVSGSYKPKSAIPCIKY